MELKLRIFARILGVIFFTGGGVYVYEEFLPAVSENTKIISVSTDGKNYQILLANRTEVITDRIILLPPKDQPATVWYTPWFRGLKGIKYDAPHPLSGELLQQSIGNPDGPRPAPLIVSVLLMLICLVPVFARRFEIAVGTAIFAIVLAAVRFWVLRG
jgi:hypothetical protein